MELNSNSNSGDAASLNALTYITKIYHLFTSSSSQNFALKKNSESFI